METLQIPFKIIHSMGMAIHAKGGLLAEPLVEPNAKPLQKVPC
jgi:hypothetical protein